MKNTINLNDVMVRGYRENWNTYIEISEDDQLVYFQEFKKFLLNYCRINSRPYMCINHLSLEELINYGYKGIYNRVIFNLETKECQYIAGQDYREEIKTLKNIIKKIRHY